MNIFAEDIRMTARFLRDAARTGHTEALADDLADVYESWGPHVMEAVDFQLFPGQARLELAAAFGPRMAIEGVDRLHLADAHIAAALGLRVPVNAAEWTHQVRAAADQLAPFAG